MKKYILLALFPIIFGCNNTNSTEMKNISWNTLTGIKSNVDKTIQKTSSTAWNNNYALSKNFLSKKRNGSASLVLGESTTARFFGLIDQNTVDGFKSFNYSFYITSGNRLGIWEKAKPQGEYFSYNPSDTLTISKHKSSILYKLNNKTLKTTAIIDSTKSLYVVASLFTEGEVMNPIKCNF